MHAKAELARTWVDVRGASPPVEPVEDCVRWAFAWWPICVYLSVTVAWRS